MKPYKTLIAAPALAAVLAACAITPTLEEQEAAYLAMTQEAFASGLTVIDDPLNPSVEINTQGAYRDYKFSFGPHEDQFLRGYQFRDTGHVALQAYVTSDINGTWLHPVSVSFLHTLSTRDVERIGFDANRCTTYGCMHKEDMYFLFSTDELDQVIEAMETRGETTFAFRIQGQSGIDRDGRFHINELRAFREAVKETFRNR